MKWTDLYGLAITVTGWTVREVDEMGFPEFTGLATYWAENPPLHLMVKAYLGIERKPVSPEGEQGTLDELLDLFGAAGGQIIHVKKEGSDG